MIKVNKEKSLVHIVGDSDVIVNEILNACYATLSSAAKIDEEIAQEIHSDIVSGLAKVAYMIYEEYGIDLREGAARTLAKLFGDETPCDKPNDKSIIGIRFTKRIRKEKD